jgi:hypothetical protein
MLLDARTPCSPLLELTIEDAFALQAELQDLIRRHTMNVSAGVRPVEGGTGSELYVGSAMTKTFLNVRVPGAKSDVAYPASLTLIVTKPYKR